MEFAGIFKRCDESKHRLSLRLENTKKELARKYPPGTYKGAHPAERRAAGSSGDAPQYTVQACKYRLDLPLASADRLMPL